MILLLKSFGFPPSPLSVWTTLRQRWEPIHNNQLHMNDYAKINALIVKYGKVAAGRKVDYQPVRLEQLEFTSTYRTDTERVPRADTLNADSFKKHRPANKTAKVLPAAGSSHTHKQNLYEPLSSIANDIRMKADKKNVSESQVPRPSNTSKAAKPTKKKVAPPKKERDSKLSRLLGLTKPPRQKKEDSLTPEKSSRNRRSSSGNFVKKKFDKIDKKLENYRIQTCETFNSMGAVSGQQRKDTEREMLPFRLSIDKIKAMQKNKRSTTMRSVDRQRSNTDRLTTRSTTRTKPTEQDENNSFGRRSKNNKKSAKAAVHDRPLKNRAFQSTHLPETKQPRRRIVTQIQTEYSNDKKSYFDEEAYRRLVEGKEEVVQNKEDSEDLEEDAMLQAVVMIQRAWRGYARRKNLKKLVELRLKLAQEYPVRTPRASTQPIEVAPYLIEEHNNNESSKSLYRMQSPINEEGLRSEKSQKEREVQLERFRVSEQEKWDKMYRELRQIQASMSQNEIKKHLPIFIQMCQQNRREVENIELTVRSKNQSSLERRAHQHSMSNHSESDFELRKRQYDDAPLTLKLSRRRKSVDEGSQKSIQRQVSSKKLMGEVENFCLNDQLPAARPYQSPQHLSEEHEKRELLSTVQMISTSGYLNEVPADSDYRFKRKLQFQQADPIAQLPKQSPLQDPTTQKFQKSQDKFQQFLQLVKIDTFFQTRPDLTGLIEELLGMLSEEFATELFSSKEILHRLLTARDELSIQVKEEVDSGKINPSDLIDPQPEAPIQCSGAFVMALAQLFLLNVGENHLESFNQQLSVPFGELPINTLKYFRLAQEDEEGDSNSATNNYRTILEVESFIDFEPILKERLLMQSSVNQYFFNHCVFDCLNELLDRFRPFGMKGRPPLCSTQQFELPSYHDILQNMMQLLKSMTEMEVGRMLYDNTDVQQVSRLIEQSFRRLDICGIDQTSHQWKQNKDLEFEVTMDLTSAVADHLLAEAGFQLHHIFLFR